MTFGTRLVCGASAALLLTVVLRAAPPPTFAGLSAPGFGGQATSPYRAPSLKPEAEYLGSNACARCHEPESAQLNGALHTKMTKPVAEATIVGNFAEGTRFADHDRAYTFGRKDGKPFMTVAFGTLAPETFSIDYTLGAKRYQGYLSTLPDGRIYVLPAFWHIASKRWVDWKEITPIPDGAHEIRQIWNANCFNCHGTNIVQGYDLAAKKYNSTWTEMGIGCEGCHGPGREHVALMEAWEKAPDLRPKVDLSSKNRGLSDALKIFVTRSSEPRQVYDTCAYCHGNKTNVFTGFKGGDRYADYALPFLISEPIPPNDLQGEFWPDGRPNRFNRPQALTLSGCFKAGAIACTNCHVAHGSPNDFSLKVNINEGRNGDALCTQCHTTPKPRQAAAVGLQASAAADLAPEVRSLKPSFQGAALEQHTRHVPDSPGSRCIGCHMSDVNWRLLIRRRDHTFQPPVPETTARFGVPNACTTCHDEKTPEWAARQMNAWWGDGERRARSTAMADTMYRAGSGDGSVVPALASLAVDRTQGMVIRASAAEFIARLVAEGRSGAPQRAANQSQTSFDDRSSDRSNAGSTNVRGTTAGTTVGTTAGTTVGTTAGTTVGTTAGTTVGTAVGTTAGTTVQITPTIVNALIGAASDPEPVVRAAALKALATIGDRERALAPVLARLVDQSRVVRARAAEVLVSFGIVELPGNAGEALKRAQAEYILSLEMFPDVASNHAARGWLEAERGRVPEARIALDAAITVEPKYAFPWVVKGVLLAREGKFAEAVELWEKARSIEPSYPNIDQLIAEAQKRK